MFREIRYFYQPYSSIIRLVCRNKLLLLAPTPSRCHLRLRGFCLTADNRRHRRQTRLSEFHADFVPRGGPVVPVMDQSKELTTNFSPPDSVRGMTELDRGAFEKKVYVAGIIFNVIDHGRVRHSLNKYAIRIPGITIIQKYSEENATENKIMLLDPKYVRSVNDYDERVRYAVRGVLDFKKCYRVLELKLSYQNWSADEVLKAILPEGEHVAGYTIVGHLAHFNLKPHHEPFKGIIGQVILDKVKNVKTVVSKTDSIDTVFRYFKMELMAGEDNTVVTAKENGCTFKLDFAKVYWNSRLGTEHERIVSLVEAGDLVYDVFAGVGPFAIPCAKKGATVIANDLNPESYKWLNENVKLNSSKKRPITMATHNMDGRDFIKDVVKEDLKTRSGVDGKIHVVMNLPGLALEFLDAFVDLFAEEECPDKEMDVHCYTFSKAETDEHDPVVDVRTRAEAVLGTKLAEDHTIRHVRNVSPNKDMYCISFTLIRNVLVSENGGSKRKKIKLSDDC